MSDLLATAFSVLMVGHSLFGPTGPTMLEEALLTGTGHGSVQAQIINGAPLKYNWERSAEAQGVDARAVLPQGAITHLILTEAIPLDNHVKWSQTDIFAQAFTGLAVAANPDVRIYVQETWHSLKSGTGEEVAYDAKADIPWRLRLDRDLPVWEGIVTDIAAGLTSDTASVSLIPAGQAMALLHDEIEVGRVEGLDNIAQLFDDDIHLNDMGHYFVAMVQFATLTGRDPLGLSRDLTDSYGQPFDTPDQDLARALQRIAWTAVQNYQARVPRTVPPVPERATASPASEVSSCRLPTLAESRCDRLPSRVSTSDNQMRRLSARA